MNLKFLFKFLVCFLIITMLGGKKQLNIWKWRGLTLIGRTQIVKSFAIPKVMSKATLIPVSSELIKRS